MPENFPIFKNISIRLKGYDYRNKGAYFITICTRNRNHYFGECANGVMHLSVIGLLAEKFWFEIPNHFPNASLGAFVVMPNHVHGVLVIDEKVETSRDEFNSTGLTNQSLTALSSILPSALPSVLPSILVVGANINHSDSFEPDDLPKLKNKYFQDLSAPAKSISTMMRAYKSVVTSEARKIGLTFAWQSRFHDHIIRNYLEWGRIHDYILNNPVNWKEDRFC